MNSRLRDDNGALEQQVEITLRASAPFLLELARFTFQHLPGNCNRGREHEIDYKHVLRSAYERRSDGN